MQADRDPSTTQPERRIGAVALIRDMVGRVLMVKPTYKDGWILPGGNARSDEHAYAACIRKMQEEIGIPLVPGRLLVVDYVPRNPQTDSPEGYDFVYDCGTVPDGIAVTLGKPGPDEEPELRDWRFVLTADLHDYALPLQERRIRAAIAALEDSRQPHFLVEGQEAEIFS